MTTKKRKLTKRTIDSLRPDPAGKDVIHFDSEVPRFGVRVKPSGAMSYVLQYRNRFGQGRRYTIAKVGDLTPDQARNKAIELRGRIAKGEDPAGDKKADRKAQTVAQLCDEYLASSKGLVKESTLRNDRSRIECHIKPLLGSKPVKTLRPRDIATFLRDVMAGRTASTQRRPDTGLGAPARGGPVAASRAVGLLHTILQAAVRDGVLAQNPASRVTKPKDQRAKPPFSFEQIAALGAALREAEAEGENLSGVRAIRHLLLTGCRKMEALTLRRSMIDKKARCLRLPDTKSGPQFRPLGRVALEHLASFETRGNRPNEYVFPGTKAAAHYVALPDCWERIAAKAGIEGVTLHGLRHWFASAATDLNYSDLIIGGLLGHAARGVTGRYATAPDPALLAAADRVSQRLADALDGREQGNVVSFGAA